MQTLVAEKTQLIEEVKKLNIFIQRAGEESDMKMQKETRIKRSREAKDADKINNLLMKNENMKKEIETKTNENAKLIQHIENIPSVVDVQVYRLYIVVLHLCMG